MHLAEATWLTSPVAASALQPGRWLLCAIRNFRKNQPSTHNSSFRDAAVTVGDYTTNKSITFL